MGASPANPASERWLEIDKHFSLELCFSIEKQHETVSPRAFSALGKQTAVYI